MPVGGVVRRDFLKCAAVAAAGLALGAGAAVPPADKSPAKQPEPTAESPSVTDRIFRQLNPNALDFFLDLAATLGEYQRLSVAHIDHYRRQKISKEDLLHANADLGAVIFAESLSNMMAWLLHLPVDHLISKNVSPVRQQRFAAVTTMLAYGSKAPAYKWIVNPLHHALREEFRVLLARDPDRYGYQVHRMERKELLAALRRAIEKAKPAIHEQLNNLRSKPIAAHITGLPKAEKIDYALILASSLVSLINSGLAHGAASIGVLAINERDLLQRIAVDPRSQDSLEEHIAVATSYLTNIPAYYSFNGIIQVLLDFIPGNRKKTATSIVAANKRETLGYALSLIAYLAVLPHIKEAMRGARDNENFWFELMRKHLDLSHCEPK